MGLLGIFPLLYGVLIFIAALGYASELTIAINREESEKPRGKNSLPWLHFGLGVYLILCAIDFFGEPGFKFGLSIAYLLAGCYLFYLFIKGISKNEKYKNARQDIHLAIIDHPESNHATEIARQYFDGADLNIQDDNGWTALHFAAQYQSVSAVKTLIKFGAEVDLKNNNGNTPLYRAVFCFKEDLGVVKLLLDHGANPDLENKRGESPRSLAADVQGFAYKKYFTQAQASLED